MSTTLNADQPKETQASFSYEQSTDSDQHAGPCLQLKGSLVPMTVLELHYFTSEKFKAELAAKTAQAPDFFENLPVVIGLEKFNDKSAINFDQLTTICAQFSIKAVAIRGGNEGLQAQAKASGLGVLAKQKQKSTSNHTTTEPATEAISDATTNPEKTNKQTSSETTTQLADTHEASQVNAPTLTNSVETVPQTSKLIHQPVRSGQQVYAAGGDLIIMASVSAGAEILADGNIHVYGTLRGRALAGVKGNTKARIFCHRMSAELVSIAGQYKISEDIDKHILGQATQVYLDKDQLHFKKLEF